MLLSMVKINANKPRIQRDGDFETKTSDSGAAVATAPSSYYFNVLPTTTSKYIHPWPGLLTRQTGSSPD